MAGLPAVVFRRGGQKKELFSAAAGRIDGDGEGGRKHARDEDALVDSDADGDGAEAHVALGELRDVLSLPRAGREHSAAIWRPELMAAEMVKPRKGTAQHSGFSWRRRHFLHAEEAVFFVDRGDLMLFADSHGQQRLLSVQEAYDLMVTSGVGQDRALVYSQLMRSGYVVVRHPSLWVLPADTFPSDGWREWLAGPGSGDDGRGTAGDGAAGDEGTAAGDEAGCGGDGDCRDGGGGGSGEFGWPRVTSAPSAAHVGGDAAGDGAAGIAGTGGTGGTGVSNAEACRHMRAEGRSAAASGRPPPPAEAAAATACSRPLSRWWAAADASHPHLRGVAQQWFVECTPRHAVEPSLGHMLRAEHPRLRPLPAHAPAPGGDAPAPGGDAAAPSALCFTPNVPHRATPHTSCRATLLYDVYAPGARLSRKAQQYPPVKQHIALCNGSPPSVEEMRIADALAADFAAARGVAAAPVVWASVDASIVSYFQLAQADLIQLM